MQKSTPITTFEAALFIKPPPLAGVSDKDDIGNDRDRQDHRAD